MAISRVLECKGLACSGGGWTSVASRGRNVLECGDVIGWWQRHAMRKDQKGRTTIAWIPYICRIYGILRVSNVQTVYIQYSTVCLGMCMYVCIYIDIDIYISISSG